MPNHDGTGPNGNGPKSGRSQGRCGSNNSNAQPERRNGLGRGSGMGFKNRQTNNDKQWLERAIEEVKNQLKTLEKRKKDIES